VDFVYIFLSNSQKIKSVTIGTDVVKLQIWDTAGQERFHTITTSYYHSANGIAVVYDIANRESFDSVTQWFEEVEKAAAKEVCKMLIGNKSDLAQTRAVSFSEGSDLARSLGIPFLETSAKLGQGVDQLFLSMGRFVLEKRREAQGNLSGQEAQPLSLGNRRTVTGEPDQSASYCYC
jgi:Ras-related protein Rab-1A